jgi:hypothetical protein
MKLLVDVMPNEKNPCPFRHWNCEYGWVVCKLGKAKLCPGVSECDRLQSVEDYGVRKSTYGVKE